MSDRTRMRIHDETLPDAGIVTVSDAAYQMKVGDHIIYADSSSNAVVLTLPSMAEAVGKFYFIQAPNGVTHDVSVFIKETAAEIATYGDMDADGDHALFFCTGRAWITVFDGVA